MSAARKLTAEQRAARRWHRPAKLHLVKLTPAESEIVSPRVQNIVVGIVLIAAVMLVDARAMGWL